MNPERTIAIAITSKFRKTMDDTFRPGELDKKTLFDEVEQAMVDTAPYSGTDMTQLPEHFKNTFKTMIFDAKQKIVDQQRETYDSMLTSVVSDALYELEQYFQSNYSEDELAQIAVFVESEVGKKMMLDMGVTNLLHIHQDKIRMALNEIVYEITSTEDIAGNLGDMLISAAFPNGIDEDQDEEYFDEYEEYEDEDDEW